MHVSLLFFTNLQIKAYAVKITVCTIFIVFDGNHIASFITITYLYGNLRTITRLISVQRAGKAAKS